MKNIIKLRQYVQTLIERSPRDIIITLKKKLKGISSYYNEEILRSKKYMESTKLIDRLFRYQRVISNKIPWNEIEFKNKKVLEIGSGPLLGWGPIALYLGCEKYVCVEPAYNCSILDSDKIWRGYFLCLYNQLEAIFNRSISFKAFKDAILKDIVSYSTNFGDVDIDRETFDIILTNSVLEHVKQLEQFIIKLKYLSSPECLHMHAVDFNNHRRTENPFDEIYQKIPDEYFKKYGRNINLKKPSEIIHLFKSSGLEVQLVPYLTYKDFEILSPYWKDFSIEDLSIEVAFIVKM